MVSSSWLIFFAIVSVFCLKHVMVCSSISSTISDMRKVSRAAEAKAITGVKSASSSRYIGSASLTVLSSLTGKIVLPILATHWTIGRKLIPNMMLKATWSVTIFLAGSRSNCENHSRIWAAKHTKMTAQVQRITMFADVI